MTNVRLLGISGSIRRQSANTAVLEALRLRLVENGSAALSLFGLADIPLFSCDLEGERLPHAVQAFREAILASDALVICCPEYNHGMSGVLKNALDWASRPTLGAAKHDSPLKGKPALIMTAASSMLGGVRALYQMRETLVACHARVIARPDVVIPKVHEKIVAGKFADEGTLSFASQAVGDLVAEVLLLRPTLQGRSA
jgi:chromate reductase, NAD(P)H dehydrogenase (quinone)